MMKSPQRFHNIISQPSNRLASICVKLQKLQQLDHLLQQVIQRELGGSMLAGQPINTHCRIMNLEGNTLILAADNSSWATQLRYRSAPLLQALRHHDDWSMIKKITIIVHKRDDNPTNREDRYPQRHLSKQDAMKIRSAAKTIKHPTLKKILLQLADRQQ